MDAFPDVIRFEVAGRCNYRCTYCPVGVEGGKRDLMPLVTFWNIFESLPVVPRVAVFCHGGEPLLNPMLEEMVRYAKQRGVKKTVLNTNASLLTVRRAQTLGAARLDEMRLSFHGESAEANDRVRVGGNFQKQAEVIREIIQLPARPRIVIYSTGIDSGYLRDAFGDAVEYRSDPVRVWARVDGNPLEARARYCPDLFETMTFLANGKTVLCCEDIMGDIVTGDTELSSPLDIWREMQGIRDAFRAGNYPAICRTCTRVTRDA